MPLVERPIRRHLFWRTRGEEGQGEMRQGEKRRAHREGEKERETSMERLPWQATVGIFLRLAYGKGSKDTGRTASEVGCGKGCISVLVVVTSPVLKWLCL
jgi:hypothetical protein